MEAPTDGVLTEFILQDKQYQSHQNLQHHLTSDPNGQLSSVLRYTSVDKGKTQATTSDNSPYQAPWHSSLQKQSS